MHSRIGQEIAHLNFSCNGTKDVMYIPFEIDLAEFQFDYGES